VNYSDKSAGWLVIFLMGAGLYSAVDVKPYDRPCAVYISQAWDNETVGRRFADQVTSLPDRCEKFDVIDHTTNQHLQTISR